MSIHKKIANRGWDGLFACIQTSDVGGPIKPAARRIKTALNRAAKRAEEKLDLQDELDDLDAAV